MSELKLWQFILSQLESYEPVVLMCVMESHGSSPGRRGFKMAVTAEHLVGSIGGGMMEHKFVEMAKEVLADKQTEIILKRQIHSKSAKLNQSGMICSGEQTIYLSLLKRDDIDTVHAIIASLLHMQNGTLHIDPTGISFGILPTSEEYHFEMKNEEKWKYAERTGYKNILHIVGGGHCSLALSELMSKLDFKIYLYDDRPGLNTMNENNFVHSKNLVKSYEELENIIHPGKNVYVVIMTFGYRSDNIALRAIVNKDFKYLGVLGSQTKMTELFKEWKADGIPEEKLNRIFSPIGLNIRSQTPMEIAISIAAQIVQVKNADLP
jgi:xanthine dehydrogenase accessory factor